tara:strand:+ start:400 stop:762 length:363 start_codon:yes stop_codon:yes gene_type:complete
MKQILTIYMMLLSLVSYSQDTTVVMVTLNEILTFKWGEPDTVLTRVDHKGKVEFEVQPDTVVCLHLFDEFERWRDIESTSLTGIKSDHVQGTVASTAAAFYCLPNTNGIKVTVSKARRRR